MAHCRSSSGYQVGNTHFWSEIAVNLAGWGGQKLAGILHPGTFSMLGVGVSMAVAAKNTHPDATVVLISGDGAFLSGGLSIEAAFQENLPIVVVIDKSKQGGFEIYLNDGKLGSALWDLMWEAGREFNMTPGCPNLIERIEGGLLSYGNEFTRENNPFEAGLGKFCQLDGSVDYLGCEALQQLARDGHRREMRGVLFDGGTCPPCGKPWPVMAGHGTGPQIGQITSAAWSPRLARNVGLSMIERAYWEPGQPVTVASADGATRPGEISALPFA